MKAKATNPDFLNGVPELLILQLLARQPMHGYEVVRAISRETQAQLEFGEGSIYPILHRLERDKLLAAKSEAVGNRTRIVYRVTPSGLKRLKEVTKSWSEIVAAVQGVLNGGSTDAHPEMA